MFSGPHEIMERTNFQKCKKKVHIFSFLPSTTLRASSRTAMLSVRSQEFLCVFVGFAVVALIALFRLLFSSFIETKNVPFCPFLTSYPGDSPRRSRQPERFHSGIPYRLCLRLCAFIPRQSPESYRGQADEEVCFNLMLQSPLVLPYGLLLE